MRTILPRPTSDFEKTLPTEIAFADEVDFIGLEFADIAEVQKTLKNITYKSMQTRQNKQHCQDQAKNTRAQRK